MKAESKPATKKTNLFNDEEEDGEDFFKKKAETKPSPQPVKKAQAKKNLLLDEGDSDDDFFKKKPLPKVPATEKKVEEKSKVTIK